VQQWTDSQLEEIIAKREADIAGESRALATPVHENPVWELERQAQVLEKLYGLLIEALRMRHEVGRRVIEEAGGAERVTALEQRLMRLQELRAEVLDLRKPTQLATLQRSIGALGKDFREEPQGADMDE
jgi:predicted translin family RNA/ssDNA-binding protein